MSDHTYDRDHYVAQFHLKRFGDRSGHVYVWDKVANEILPETHTITDFAYFRGMYTASADRTLQNSEAETARIIRKKLRPDRQDTWSLSEREVRALLLFVALSIVRSPVYESKASTLRESTLQSIQKLTPKVIMPVRGIDIPVNRSRLTEIVQSLDPFNEMLADGHRAIDRIVDYLKQLSLQHIVSPSDTEFIISDYPTNPLSFTLNRAIGPMTLIFLPLSRRNALVFTGRSTAANVTEALGVNTINAIQVAGSIRYTFSTDKGTLQKAGSEGRTLLKQSGVETLHSL